jgi:hypothetical protein
MTKAMRKYLRDSKAAKDQQNTSHMTEPDASALGLKTK